jgi:hypothetical protein
MHERFADRIAGWRERVALDDAARAATARPPSAEIEIVDVETATAVEKPVVPRPRRRAGARLIAAVAVVAAIGVVAQRQLGSSHAARPTTAAMAATPAATPAATATTTPALVIARAPVPVPTATTAAPPPAAPPIARAASAATRHHRSNHHRAAKRAAAAPAPPASKSAPSQHPPSNWNPEDALPPGTAH